MFKEMLLIQYYRINPRLYDKLTNENIKNRLKKGPGTQIFKFCKHMIQFMHKMAIIRLWMHLE